ncbi:unnamed protein product [Phytophthora fragariaefolia]|uniref:Unnamed protein product n=1 Tax=Phytophthora fragariaefolia TaxID=1490495 RepID=A0A9W7CPZ1_9STRA|nr:unnamed protein product [Phytophthora fragariaefolia]
MCVVSILLAMSWAKSSTHTNTTSLGPELQDLLINQDQDENGVTGNTLVTNACKDLVDAGVMNARSDKAQKSLCGNKCYDKVNAKYKTLLDNDCFASDDADEEASAKLQAASYQIACQTNADGKYCSTWAPLASVRW